MSQLALTPKPTRFGYLFASRALFDLIARQNKTVKLYARQGEPKHYFAV